jgi:hypothetical protein
MTAQAEGHQEWLCSPRSLADTFLRMERQKGKGPRNRGSDCNKDSRPENGRTVVEECNPCCGFRGCGPTGRGKSPRWGSRAGRPYTSRVQGPTLDAGGVGDFQRSAYLRPVVRNLAKRFLSPNCRISLHPAGFSDTATPSGPAPGWDSDRRNSSSGVYLRPVVRNCLSPVRRVRCSQPPPEWRTPGS